MVQKKQLYVVMAAVTNGGHGTWAAAVVVTSSGHKAVQTARTIEQLGYSVDWSDDGVWINRIPYNTPVRYGERGVAIYQRRRRYTQGGIRVDEEFFWDPILAKECKMTEATSTTPSQPL